MICELVLHKSYASFPALHLTFSSTTLYLFTRKHSKRFIIKHPSLLSPLLLRPWLTGLCAPPLFETFACHGQRWPLGFPPIFLTILSCSSFLSFPYILAIPGFYPQMCSHSTISGWVYPPHSFNHHSRLCYSVASTAWDFKMHTSLPALHSHLNSHKSTSSQNGTMLLRV